MPKLYRPSSGTEGMMFEEQFCNNCRNERDWRVDNDACEIVFRSMCHEVEEPGYPKELTYDSDGTPTCLKYEPK